LEAVVGVGVSRPPDRTFGGSILPDESIKKLIQPKLAARGVAFGR